MAKKAVVDLNMVPSVTIFEIAGVLGCTPGAARAMCGDDLGYDWRDVPAVPASVAQRIVASARAEEARRREEERVKVLRRQERQEFVLARYRELIAERERGSFRPWSHSAGKAEIVRDRDPELHAELLAQAEKEADKRGL